MEPTDNIRLVVGVDDGGGAAVGQGQVADHLADAQKRVNVVVERTVNNTCSCARCASGGMRHSRAPKQVL